MLQNILYIIFLVLISVSNVCGQRKKVPKSEHSYSWINEQKVFVNLNTNDTLKLNNAKALSKIKILIYESFKNDSLPYTEIKNLEKYLIRCKLPEIKDVPYKISSFSYSKVEDCKTSSNISLYEFLNTTPSIKTVEKIYLTGKLVYLITTPEAINNNKNLTTFFIDRLDYISFEMVFNSKIVDLIVSKGLSYPERVLLFLFNKGTYFSYEMPENYKNEFNFSNGFKNGLIELPKDGEYVCHYKDGTPLLSGKFKNGKLDGEWILYYADSTIAQKRYYNEGKEIGDWLFYTEDGYEYFNVKYDNGTFEYMILKSTLHQYQSDTSLNWEVNTKACELIKKNTSYIDSNEYYISTLKEIQLIDCNGKIIEERTEESIYNKEKLKNTVQKFYLDGLLIKQIERVYDYNRNTYTETISKDQIITSKEYDMKSYFNGHSIDFDLHNTKKSK